MSEHVSYHDLHITTSKIPRTSIFNLPFGLMVACTRTGGWELFEDDGNSFKSIAGEYGEDKLRLDIAGHVIVDSLTPSPPKGDGE